MTGVRRLVGWSIAFGVAFTLVVTFDSSVRFAYRNTVLHAVFETSIALVGGAVAFLAFGRFQQRHHASDLGITVGVTILALRILVFNAIPLAIWSDAARSFATWSPLCVRIVGTAVLAVSPWLGARRVAARDALYLALATAALLVAISVVIAAASPALPSTLALHDEPELSTFPDIGAEPGVAAIQAFAGVLFAIATVGFARTAERDDDVLAAWFAAGCALAVLARANYTLFPSPSSDWFYTGDILRLGTNILWLVGAGKEISSYWHDRAVAAAMDERRRVAGDLHDGLAQELAFIATQARLLTDEDERAAPLVTAAERALDESRRAIAHLRETTDTPFEDAIAQAAEDVASRVGVRVRLALDTGVRLAPANEEHVLRIVREAVTNAARHGRAQVVTVEFRTQPPLLTIRDDGRGFDVSKTSGDGFGLHSMRERARTIGADLTVHSRAGSGTVVEVSWSGPVEVSQR